MALALNKLATQSVDWKNISSPMLKLVSILSEGEIADAVHSGTARRLAPRIGA